MSVKFYRVVASIYKRLDELCCPFLQNVNEQSLAELLFHPSDSRLELLKWVVCAFDSAFEDYLETSNHLENLQHKLLTVLNIISVCNIDDAEIVSGKASQKRQIGFWDNLIDILYTSQFGYSFRNTPNDKGNSSKSHQPLELRDSFTQACKFIDALMHEHKLKELFSADVRLYSPEAKNIPECDNQSVPSLAMLIEATEKMKEDLVMKTKELESLINNLNFRELEQCNVENYCRKFDLSLKMLLQMVDSFVYSFEADVETWHKQPKAPLLNIGPNIKSLTGLARHYHSIHDNLESLKKNSNYFSDILKERRKWNDENLLKSNDLKQLREEVNILRQSISRRHPKT